MAHSCFIESEFGEVRLLTDAGAPEQRWRPEPAVGASPAQARPLEEPGAQPAAPEEPRDALWWKARAADAAAWVAERLGAERRIASVCMDIGHASCVWLSAPSAQRGVIAAALRQEGAEWAELEPGGLIEPLAPPTGASGSKLWEFSAFGLGAKKDARATSAVRMPVLLAPDALLRLFLDDLDRRAVRVEQVTSLWHAACAAWLTDADTLGAVVLCDGATLVWAWGRGASLQAGGRLDVAAHHPAMLDVADGDAPAPKPAPSPIEATRPRLALDWLTWAAQLGEAPRTLVVVGRDAATLAAALEGALPSAQPKIIEEPDPFGATVRSAANASASRATSGAEGDDPRLGLVSLTRRRGRTHRRLYTWTGACLAALAMGVGALGWRAADQRAAYLAAAADLRAAQADRLKEIAPDLTSASNPARALESRLAELRKKSPEFKDPAPARPILDETARLAAILAEMGPRGVKVDDIAIHDMVPSARITAPDFATGEEIGAKLKASGGVIRWRMDFEGNAGGDNLKYRLSGEWPKEGA